MGTIDISTAELESADGVAVVGLDLSNPGFFELGSALGRRLPLFRFSPFLFLLGNWLSSSKH